RIVGVSLGLVPGDRTGNEVVAVLIGADVIAGNHISCGYGPLDDDAVPEVAGDDISFAGIVDAVAIRADAVAGRVLVVVAVLVVRNRAGAIDVSADVVSANQLVRGRSAPG